EREPAPAKLAVIDPLMLHGEPQAIDVETMGPLDVVNPEGGNDGLDIHAWNMGGRAYFGHGRARAESSAGPDRPGRWRGGPAALHHSQCVHGISRRPAKDPRPAGGCGGGLAATRSAARREAGRRSGQARND